MYFMQYYYMRKFCRYKHTHLENKQTFFLDKNYTTQELMYMFRLNAKNIVNVCTLCNAFWSGSGVVSLGEEFSKGKSSFYVGIT